MDNNNNRLVDLLARSNKKLESIDEKTQLNKEALEVVGDIFNKSIDSLKASMDVIAANTKRKIRKDAGIPRNGVNKQQKAPVVNVNPVVNVEPVVQQEPANITVNPVVQQEPAKLKESDKRLKANEELAKGIENFVKKTKTLTVDQTNRLSEISNIIKENDQLSETSLKSMFNEVAHISADQPNANISKLSSSFGDYLSNQERLLNNKKKMDESRHLLASREFQENKENAKNISEFISSAEKTDALNAEQLVTLENIKKNLEQNASSLNSNELKGISNKIQGLMDNTSTMDKMSIEQIEAINKIKTTIEATAITAEQRADATSLQESMIDVLNGIKVSIVAGFKKTASKLSEVIKNGSSGLIAGALGILALTNPQMLIDMVVETIEVVTSVFDSIYKLFTGDFAAAWESIKEAFSSAGYGFIAVLGVIALGFGKLGGLLSVTWKGLKGAVDLFAKGLGGLGKISFPKFDSLNSISAGFSNAAKSIKGIGAGLSLKVGEFAGSIVNVSNRFATATKGLSSVNLSSAGRFVESIKGVSSKLGTAIANLAPKGLSKLSATVSGLTNSLSHSGPLLQTVTKFAKVLGPAGLVVSGLMSTYDGITAGMTEYEKSGSMFEAVKIGIAETAGAFLGWIGDIPKSIISWTAGALGFTNVEKALDGFSFSKLISDSIKNLVDYVANIDLFSMDGVSKLFGDIAGLTLDALKDGLSWVSDLFGFDGIAEWLDSFSFKDIFKEGFKTTLEFFKNLPNTIYEGIKTGLSNIASFFGFDDAAAAISNFSLSKSIEDIITNLKSVFSSENIAKTITAIPGAVLDSFKKLIEFVSNALGFKEFSDWLATISFSQMLEDGVNAVIDFVKDIPNKVMSFIKNFGIITEKAGAWLKDNLVDSIMNIVTFPYRMIKKFTSWVGSLFSGSDDEKTKKELETIDPLSTIKNIISSAIEWISGSIKKIFGMIGDALSYLNPMKWFEGDAAEAQREAIQEKIDERQENLEVINEEMAKKEKAAMKSKTAISEVSDLLMANKTELAAKRESLKTASDESGWFGDSDKEKLLKEIAKLEQEAKANQDKINKEQKKLAAAERERDIAKAKSMQEATAIAKMQSDKDAIDPEKKALLEGENLTNKIAQLKTIDDNILLQSQAVNAANAALVANTDKSKEAELIAKKDEVTAGLRRLEVERNAAINERAALLLKQEEQAKTRAELISQKGSIEAAADIQSKEDIAAEREAVLKLLKPIVQSVEKTVITPIPTTVNKEAPGVDLKSESGPSRTESVISALTVTKEPPAQIQPDFKRDTQELAKILKSDLQPVEIAQVKKPTLRIVSKSGDILEPKPLKPVAEETPLRTQQMINTNLKGNTEIAATTSIINSSNRSSSPVVNNTNNNTYVNNSVTPQDITREMAYSPI